MMDNLDGKTDDGKKEYVEHWKRVGPILERFEHEELRKSSYEDKWELIDGLLQLGFDLPNAKDPMTSGMVEQQRLFAKARRRAPPASS
jgi:hypothetical protein